MFFFIVFAIYKSRKISTSEALALRPITIADLKKRQMSQNPKKEYRSPSFPEAKERRVNLDRREDSLSNAIQPITQALINYLEVMSESLEQKIETETKNAETMLKLIEDLSNIKFQVEGVATQTRKRERKKKTDNEHHKKVKEIILRMRKNNETYQVIADQFKKDGIPTLSGRGKWHAQTVQNLFERYLKNAE